MEYIDETPLFQRCPMCGGGQRLSEEAKVSTGGTTTVCPCSRSSTPGFVAVGVNMAQLMRYLQSHRKLKAMRVPA